jgi:succinate dehydrogenase flavin-adding protein (antitoxin of CptAB toxin-antitoxin module)
LYTFANFRDDNVSNNNFLVDFVERDLLEWLAGLEPVQDVYDTVMKEVIKVIGQKVMTS